MSKPNKSPALVIKRLRNWSWRHPYVSSYAIGIIYFSLVVSWMATIKTSEIADGFLIKIVAFSVALVTVSGLALGFMVFVWLQRRSGVKWTDRQALWLIPALWVVSEYLRAILFSIISLGPDGRVGPYWTFGHLGYYLAETPVSYLSRFGGVYLLSFVIMALAVAAYQWWRLQQVRPLVLIITLVLGLTFAGWFLYRADHGQSLTIGAVEYARQDATYLRSSESYPVLSAGPKSRLDTLVLPEYSHYFDTASDREADAAVLTSLMKRDEGLIIHSRRDSTAAQSHNLLTFQTATGDTLNQQQKWFVVPAGEYVPYIYQVVLAYAGHGQLLLHFNQQKSVSRGEALERPFEYEGVSYGAHACSGVLSPDFYNQLAQQGAEIFTNSAALDTMGISPLFHHEALQMNRLAAVAHAKPFVQSAKGGPAYILDKDGKTQAFAWSGQGAVVAAEVRANSKKTVYEYVGDWIVPISGMLAIWYVIRSFIMARKQHKKL